jgi:gliding motility-associated-like protein
VVITGVSSNPAGGGGYVLAVSGVTVNVAAPSVTYGVNVLCQGTGAVATPTLTGAMGGTYASSPAGLSITAGNGSINLATSIANTYTVSYTTSGACPTATTSTVTITPSPTLTVNNPTVCAGQTATLTASGATNYGWVGNNLTAITGSTVYANTASTSVYTITGNSSGCSSVVTSTLTINPLPVVVTNFAQICPGEVAVLTTTTSIPGGTYAWLPNNQTTASITESPSTATNYTVIYTVGGCSASAIAAVNIKPLPVLTANSGFVCSGQTIVLTASASVAGGTYLWQPGGETTSSISETRETPGTYTVQYTLNGCQVSAVSSVGINPNPEAKITSSAPSIAPLDEVAVVASGGNSYIWNTGSTTAAINVKPMETTTYCATVTSVDGCKSEACVEILVKEESTLYIPNVFTPNGDEINDTFYIPSYNLVNFDLKIFNRWGQLVFQTADPLTGWDGSFKGQTISGVYVFILKAKGSDGTEYKKSGHITLIQ